MRPGIALVTLVLSHSERVIMALEVLNAHLLQDLPSPVPLLSPSRLVAQELEKKAHSRVSKKDRLRREVMAAREMEKDPQVSVSSSCYCW